MEGKARWSVANFLSRTVDKGRGLVSGDGKAKVRAAGFAIERGNYFQPCSARKRARICKAR